MGDEQNVAESKQVLSSPLWAVFLARTSGDQPAGFIEAHLREYAEGAESSPVAYLEGWYVVPAYRRRGVGARLVQAAEHWAQSRGCTEIASDTSIENKGSIEAHKHLGYVEVERQVCFLKQLAGG